MLVSSSIYHHNPTYTPPQPSIKQQTTTEQLNTLFFKKAHKSHPLPSDYSTINKQYSLSIFRLIYTATLFYTTSTQDKHPSPSSLYSTDPLVNDYSTPIPSQSTNLYFQV